MFRYSSLMLLFCILFSNIAFSQTICLQSKSEKNNKLFGQLRLFDGNEWKLANYKLGGVKINGEIQVNKLDWEPCPEIIQKPVSQEKATNKQTRKVIIEDQQTILPSVKTKVERFGIHGSNTIGAKLMPALISKYAQAVGAKTDIVQTSARFVRDIKVTKNNKDLLSISLHSKGSGTSFPALVNKTAEIGMSSRQIKVHEIASLQGSGNAYDMQSAKHEHVIALDGIIIMVNPANPIEVINKKDIAKIFSGEITDWKQVGGAPGRITIYSRDEKSGTYDVFNELILEPYNKRLASSAKLFTSNKSLSDKISTDVNGIGFTGIAYKNENRALSIKESCGIVSAPTVFNIKAEEYPLTRRLYLYTTALKSAHARELINYIQNRSVQEVVSRTGFVDQNILLNPSDNSSFNSSADRSTIAISTQKQLNEIRKKAKRLSVTFRFRTNSAELDSKARRDIIRLNKYINNNDIVDKKIHLLGFADHRGSFRRNQNLSEKRALAVKDALRNVGAQNYLSQITHKGFSEINPVACESDTKSLLKNRRVEVWLSN